MHPSQLIPVTDKSQAGEARRQASVYARQAGGDEGHIARVALVVTELAKNLDLHTTQGGVLLLRRLERAGEVGVEILALDKGPGTANFGRFMRDGFSTAGTPGTGLGAIERSSQVFEVHSQVGLGTALLCQVWSKNRFNEKETWRVGAVNLPTRHEQVSGDSWCFQELPERRARLIVADGLGHGPGAAEASRLAIQTFAASLNQPLELALSTIHESLRSTRGAAVALAEIDQAAANVSYVGVGNIAGTIYSRNKTVNLVSMNGTVGLRCERIHTYQYSWPEDGLLVMASDGLKTQWDLNRFHGLPRRHPSVIAGTLYRDFNRNTDDTTVTVVQPPL